MDNSKFLKDFTKLFESAREYTGFTPEVITAPTLPSFILLINSSKSLFLEELVKIVSFGWNAILLIFSLISRARS